MKEPEVGNSEMVLFFRGVFLEVNESVSPSMVNVLASGGYKKKELDICLKNVERHDVILELGSGIGAMSCLIQKNKPVKSYICVEAHPGMVELIKINHIINNVSNAMLLNGVLTMHPSKKWFDFYIHDDFWASSLCKSQDYREVAQVQGTNFNELASIHKPSFLICDIEGGEYELFTEEIDLSSVKKLCLEVHATTFDKAEKVFSILCKKGFFLQNEKFERGVLFFRRKPSILGHPIWTVRNYFKEKNKREN